MFSVIKNSLLNVIGLFADVPLHVVSLLIYHQRTQPFVNLLVEKQTKKALKGSTPQRRYSNMLPSN